MQNKARMTIAQIFGSDIYKSELMMTKNSGKYLAAYSF